MEEGGSLLSLRIILPVFLFLAIVSISNNAMAGTSCRMLSGDAYNGISSLLTANITVGRDVPLGAVIYRQSFQKMSAYNISCMGDPGKITTEKYVLKLDSTPRALSGWNTGLYAGKVYLTGVPGIGVAFSTQGNVVFPFDSAEGAGGCATSFCNTGAELDSYVNKIDVVFLKIGDVGNGVITGGDLPSVSVNISINKGSAVYYILKFSLTGSMNVISKTCKASDVLVSMGAHHLSEFSGVGTYTSGKNFEVKLAGCPAFFGSYPIVGPTYTSKGSNFYGDFVGNSIQMRIDPISPAIDASRGILSITPSTDDKHSGASGVGLQISNERGSLPLGQFYNVLPNLQQQDGGSYSIPLSARYIQTGSKLEAGPANAMATFTISYQ